MKTEMNTSDMKARETIRSESGRNVFIQASAGTGKTTLIVDRVIELLRIGIPLERLAVVTFTNAAAAELRSRIREKLRSMKNSDEKEFDEALEYYKLYTSIKDSIYNSGKMKIISEMQTKYETEKKEKENKKTKHLPAIVQ